MRSVYSHVVGCFVVGAVGMGRTVSSLEAQEAGGPIPPPPPEYEVRVERALMVPVRDGVRLSTDLYFPVGLEGKLPVILIRTPYNKKLLLTKQGGAQAAES